MSAARRRRNKSCELPQTRAEWPSGAINDSAYDSRHAPSSEPMPTPSWSVASSAGIKAGSRFQPDTRPVASLLIREAARGIQQYQAKPAAPRPAKSSVDVRIAYADYP